MAVSTYTKKFSIDIGTSEIKNWSTIIILPVTGTATGSPLFCYYLNGNWHSVSGTSVVKVSSASIAGTLLTIKCDLAVYQGLYKACFLPPPPDGHTGGNDQ